MGKTRIVQRKKIIPVWKSSIKEYPLFYACSDSKKKDPTDAIESINSSFQKVTKKGAFPNENALFKLLYLRCKELERKWEDGHIQNWSMVLNQLMMNELFTSRIEKYLK